MDFLLQKSFSSFHVLGTKEADEIPQKLFGWGILKLQEIWNVWKLYSFDLNFFQRLNIFR